MANVKFHELPSVMTKRFLQKSLLKLCVILTVLVSLKNWFIALHYPSYVTTSPFIFFSISIVLLSMSAIVPMILAFALWKSVSQKASFVKTGILVCCIVITTISALLQFRPRPLDAKTSRFDVFWQSATTNDNNLVTVVNWARTTLECSNRSMNLPESESIVNGLPHEAFLFYSGIYPARPTVELCKSDEGSAFVKIIYHVGGSLSFKIFIGCPSFQLMDGKQKVLKQWKNGVYLAADWMP